MSVNKVIIVGRLGAEPESRSFPSGGSVCNINVATTETWKDKQTGERQEKTEWHRCVLRNKLGEIAQQYLHKGSQVYLEGKLQTRKWQDQSGQDKFTTEIVGRNMTMLDSKPQSGADNTQYGDSKPAAQNEQPKAVEEDYYDDDIPF